jgi:hypothetical protein
MNIYLQIEEAASRSCKIFLQDPAVHPVYTVLTFRIVGTVETVQTVETSSGMQELAPLGLPDAEAIP